MTHPDRFRHWTQPDYEGRLGRGDGPPPAAVDAQTIELGLIEDQAKHWRPTRMQFAAGCLVLEGATAVVIGRFDPPWWVIAILMPVMTFFAALAVITVFWPRPDEPPYPVAADASMAIGLAGWCEHGEQMLNDCARCTAKHEAGP